MILTDLSATWDGDLALSASGDLALVEPGTGKAYQRLIRTLFTNPDAMELHPDFGAGIGSWEGQTFGQSQAQALQSLVYQNVLGDPDITDPEVSVDIVNPSLVSVTVSYLDAVTGQPSTFSFGVGA